MKFWAVVALVVIGVGAATCAVQTIRDQAAREAIEKVRQSNEFARDKAQTGQDAVDRCYSDNGVWDRANGVCKHDAR